MIFWPHFKFSYAARSFKDTVGITAHCAKNFQAWTGHCAIAQLNNGYCSSVRWHNDQSKPENSTIFKVVTNATGKYLVRTPILRHKDYTQFLSTTNPIDVWSIAIRKSFRMVTKINQAFCKKIFDGGYSLTLADLPPLVIVSCVTQFLQEY